VTKAKQKVLSFAKKHVVARLHQTTTKYKGGGKGSFVAIINIKTTMEMASIDRLKD
jgi:hypothetical protein